MTFYREGRYGLKGVAPARRVMADEDLADLAELGVSADSARYLGARQDGVTARGDRGCGARGGRSDAGGRGGRYSNGAEGRGQNGFRHDLETLAEAVDAEQAVSAKTWFDGRAGSLMV